MSDERQEPERLEEEAQADLEVPEEASEEVRGGAGTDAGGTTSVAPATSRWEKLLRGRRMQ